VAVIALGAVVVAVTPHTFGLEQGLNGVSSGRGGLVTGGGTMFTQHPLQGYGSGSFQREYEAHSKTGAENATSASHTIPVTVAAEQGIVGLALYIALLIVAFVTLFRGAGRAPPDGDGDCAAADDRADASVPPRVARQAIAACFAALVLHTFAYADFLEDPLTWTLLGVGLALARADGDVDPVRWMLRGRDRERGVTASAATAE
jgi:O-antigen ligase